MLTKQVDDSLLSTASDIRSAAIRTMDGVIGFPSLALNLTAEARVQVWQTDGVLAVQAPGLEELPLDDLA
ncbi:MAG TPA: hypothetical protein VI729_05765, partial [Anaerolineales bacterium]|nr:hypothetical protein [Anaerolineales bacterium]